MKWIKLCDRTPIVEVDGKKVLVYRIVNESQSSSNPSIFPVNKIHLCDQNETWWMSLPDDPKTNLI